jgi:hypothetical protein
MANSPFNWTRGFSQLHRRVSNNPITIKPKAKKTVAVDTVQLKDGIALNRVHPNSRKNPLTMSKRPRLTLFFIQQNPPTAST